MRNRIIKFISAFFYIGFLPFAPGTFASIAGIILYYLIKGNSFIYLSSTLIIMLLGFFTCVKAERIFNQNDARCIVIDEISGMLLALLFIPYDIKLVIIAFILFRLLDILKPFPADKIHGLGGSLGIMGDDIVAGLYTNIILQLALRFSSFKIS